MIYDRKLGPSHFYGNGDADPLRKDPTLQSLEAKATRLMLMAARQGCLCANLSPLNNSRLTFPKFEATELGKDLSAFHLESLAMLEASHDPEAMADVLLKEQIAGQFVASGKYWQEGLQPDPEKLAEIDEDWRSTAYRAGASVRA